VDSAAPGFRRVTARPHLGKLNSVSGSVPLPKGEVEVRIEPKGAGFEVTVSLPEGVTGEFEWKGTQRELAAGVNRFAMVG
jgi:alpha-L-rhamnosidase